MFRPRKTPENAKRMEARNKLYKKALKELGVTSWDVIGNEDLFKKVEAKMAEIKAREK